MTFRTAFCAAAAAALTGAPAWAQSSQLTHGSIAVMDPVELTQTAEFAVRPVARPKLGSLTLPIEGSSYTLKGLTGESFNLAAPATLTLKRSGGDEQIVMSLTPNQTSGLLQSRGERTGSVRLQLDGDLPISSTTAAGLYTGNYDLTVDYP